MVHLWRRAKDEIETHASAPGVGATGDIAVIVDGKKLDHELVRLACQIAKKAKRKVHLVHIIEVPRTLPLKATLTTESEHADSFLNEALALADEAGCEAVAEIVQTRDAGPAIVDEAKDQACALIVLGMLRTTQKRPANDTTLSRAVLYILSNAPCRVWMIQD